jgi:hypothetical protein
MLFALLNNELSEDFHKFKIMLNPSKDLPPHNFIDVIQRWIENMNSIAIKVKAILLDIHYIYVSFPKLP